MRIYIDAGHGGNDPGAVGPTGLREKDITLKVSSMVKSILERHKIEAPMTRSDDRRVELSDRVKVANTAGCDAFISIHINSAGNNKATGTETFAYKTSVKGNALAKSIQQSLVKEIQLADRGVKNADFYVIRKTNMPSALVEVAFINNPAEEALMRDEKFLKKSADGIARGILEYFKVEYIEEGALKPSIPVEPVNPLPVNPIPPDKNDEISEWAKDAMAWGKSIGITDGTNPKEPVNLERMITILYRLMDGKR